MRRGAIQPHRYSFQIRPDISTIELFPQSATASIAYADEPGPDGIDGIWKITYTGLASAEAAVYIDFNKAATAPGVEYYFSAYVRIDSGDADGSYDVFCGIESEVITNGGNTRVFSQLSIGQWSLVEFPLIMSQDNIDALPEQAEVFIKISGPSDAVTFSVARVEMRELSYDTYDLAVDDELYLSSDDSGLLPRSYAPEQLRRMIAHSLQGYGIARDRLNLFAFPDPFFFGYEPDKPQTGDWELINGFAEYETSVLRGPNGLSVAISRFKRTSGATEPLTLRRTFRFAYLKSGNTRSPSSSAQTIYRSLATSAPT